jgi:hypothetical protein
MGYRPGELTRKVRADFLSYGMKVHLDGRKTVLVKLSRPGPNGTRRVTFFEGPGKPDMKPVDVPPDELFVVVNED